MSRKFEHARGIIVFLHCLASESDEEAELWFGYRIIEANIRELLDGAPSQLSWC